LKTIPATFAIIVATVLGYHYGQRPTDAAERHAMAEASELNNDVKQNIETISSDQQRAHALKGHYGDLIDRIDRFPRDEVKGRFKSLKNK
jgi:hypothetical protein